MSITAQNAVPSLDIVRGLSTHTSPYIIPDISETSISRGNYHYIARSLPTKLFHSRSSNGLEVHGEMIEISQGLFRGIPIIVCEYRISYSTLSSSNINIERMVVDLSFRSTTGIIERNRSKNSRFPHVDNLNLNHQGSIDMEEMEILPHPHIVYCCEPESQLMGFQNGKLQFNKQPLCEDDPTRCNRMILTIDIPTRDEKKINSVDKSNGSVPIRKKVRIMEPEMIVGPPIEFGIVLIGYQGDFRVSMSVDTILRDFDLPRSSFRWRDTMVLNGDRIRQTIKRSFSQDEENVSEEDWDRLLSTLGIKSFD